MRDDNALDLKLQWDNHISSVLSRFRNYPDPLSCPCYSCTLPFVLASWSGPAPSDFKTPGIDCACTLHPSSYHHEEHSLLRVLAGHNDGKVICGVSSRPSRTST